MRRVADAQVTACPFCQSESFADGVCRAGCSPKDIETAQKFYALPVAGIEPKHLASTEAPDISWDVTNDYTDLVRVLRFPAHAQAAFGGKLRWNSMALCRMAGGKRIEDATISGAMEVLRLRFRTKKGTPVKFSFEDLERASLQVAQESVYHPVAEWLQGLPAWDEIPRISSLPDCVLPLHVDCREVGRKLLGKWFLSAVARALSPGCPVHTMLILTGAQGVGKSRFFRALAGEWFSDTVLNINEPARAAQTLQGGWIHELSELESLLRSRSAETTKGWLTSASDNVHLPYAHENSIIQRSSICVGTSNREQFLEDETGERRFWPLRVTGRVNIEALEAQRVQLWAETLHRYSSGETWWYTAEQQLELEPLTSAHKRIDAWTEAVEAWVGSTIHNVTTANVLSEAIHKEVGHWNRADEMRVAAILKTLGWENIVRRDGKRTYRVWNKRNE